MAQQNASKFSKRGVLKRPVEEVRAELLKDPETKRIAEAVSMKLEDYVELVLKYATDPNKEPVLNVMPDAQAKAEGYPVHSTEEVAQFFVDAAKGELPGQGNPFSKSGFDSGAGATGKKPSLTAPAGDLPQGPKDPALRKELLDQVKKGGGTRG